MRTSRSILLDGLILVVLLAFGGVAYLYHNQILDWYYLRNYTPPAAVAALADQASMTDAGRHLFYRARPQIDTERTQLSAHCRIADDKTIELGCYLSTDQIYLLNIQQSELKDEMVVTAAHETLHAAYDRLGGAEKHRINAELEQVAATINDASLKQRLADYAKVEPGEQDNELHSIIGTEFGNLPPDLESHYATYFSNRSQIIAYNQTFNRTFDGLHTQIIQLDAKITATKAQMQMFLAAGQVARYNTDVPIVNAEITSYNQKVEQYNQYSRDLLGQKPAASAH